MKTRWQEELMNVVTDPALLLDLLELDPALLPAATAASQLFPLKVPRGFIARMKKKDPKDPLLLQVLPLQAELNNHREYTKDPLHEMEKNPVPGLLHKYYGRVLVTLSGTCPVHCRYCFRRHFPYEKNNPNKTGREKIIDYIAQDKTLSEVILSGGDPLMVNDNVLHHFTESLSTITHIKRLRIHSRIPIVLPERITSEFLAWIASIPFQTIVVVHCNHPQEINESVKDAATWLKKSNVTLLNQSVLLKGINDDAKTLMALSEKLFEIGIQPYYLHLLDKVEGAAHFDQDIKLVKSLLKEMMEKSSGYLVPKLVYEKAGAKTKIPVFPTNFCTELF